MLLFIGFRVAADQMNRLMKMQKFLALNYLRNQKKKKMDLLFGKRIGKQF